MHSMLRPAALLASAVLASACATDEGQPEGVANLTLGTEEFHLDAIFGQDDGYLTVSISPFEGSTPFEKDLVVGFTLQSDPAIGDYGVAGLSFDGEENDWRLIVDHYRPDALDHRLATEGTLTITGSEYGQLDGRTQLFEVRGRLDTVLDDGRPFTGDFVAPRDFSQF